MSSKIIYDTIIIGGGPAGYLAAERLGSQKKKILLLEEQKLGGTCLNTGCIPAKTLLHSAKLYAHVKETENDGISSALGVKAEGVSYNWSVMQSRKTEVVNKLRSGIESQMKRFGVELLNSIGEILGAPAGEKPAMVRSVSHNGETAVHEGKTILVCTGSVPVWPSIPGAKDNPLVLDSSGLLAAETVPKRLAVIGGGVIGLEFAGIFSALGSKVTVIEMMDEIVPYMDRELAPIFRKAMNNVEFRLGCKVEKIENCRAIDSREAGGAVIHFSDKKGNAETTETGLILMATGRRPVLESWGAAAAGVEINAKGVVVNDRMRTNIPGIWAAGDLTGRSLLAHSAYRMAEVAAADILNVLGETSYSGGGRSGAADRFRDNAVPWALFGITEAAGVGITEQDAEAKGIAILKAALPMRASGRFVAENTAKSQGAVKVIAGAKDRRILGVHAVGAYAPEFIWGGAALIEQEFRIDEVKQLIFPHPTVSELIRDAVWALE